MFSPDSCFRRAKPAAHRAASLAVAGLMALGLSVGTARAASPSETVDVVVDHAKVVRLPEKAQTVIVGNPGIADVSVQRNGVMVVTGKSFGVTNLIALDASGALLAESLVRVGASSNSMLTVQRGLERESYSCTPSCQPAVQLGDATKFFSDVGGQTRSRNALASGKGN